MMSLMMLRDSWIVYCFELIKCHIVLFGLCYWTVARENSGEHWFSCPSEHDLAKARLTEARPSYFTRIVAHATHILSE